MKESWLDGDDVVLLHDTASADVGEAWLSVALGCAWQVATDIVDVEADEVAESVGHEDEGDAVLQHLVHVT